jgi:hypothetical protein
MKRTKIYGAVGSRFQLMIACAIVGSMFAGAQSPPSGVSNAQARGPVIGGETFVRRVIADPQQGGIQAATIYLPATWRFESKIQWNYAWVENPFAFSCRAENPANAEAYFGYPMLVFDSLQYSGNLRQFARNQPKQGERALGAILLDPRPPAQIMASFAHNVRGREPNCRFVGKENLPGLPKALGKATAPGAQGIAVKVSYELNGQPVEEAFYGVYYTSRLGTQGGAGGGISQIRWGLLALQSFRVPAGTLGKRMPVFAAIATSLHPTPQWTQRANAVNAQLTQMFYQKLKQENDQTRAALAMAQQVMANEASFDQSVNAYIQANRASGAGGGGSTGGRTIWDKWDDNVRGVDTTNDPMTGTSQHSNLEQYHWTDGFGNYSNTNDPNYDPGKDEAGNWTLMTPAQ